MFYKLSIIHYPNKCNTCQYLMKLVHWVVLIVFVDKLSVICNECGSISDTVHPDSHVSFVS